MGVSFFEGTPQNVSRFLGGFALKPPNMGVPPTKRLRSIAQEALDRKLIAEAAFKAMPDVDLMREEELASDLRPKIGASPQNGHNHGRKWKATENHGRKWKEPLVNGKAMDEHFPGSNSWWFTFSEKPADLSTESGDPVRRVRGDRKPGETTHKKPWFYRSPFCGLQPGLLIPSPLSAYVTS